MNRGEIAARLVDRMEASCYLEIGDEDGFTPLALGALHDYPGILKLLQLMVNKNPNLPDIGHLQTLPVIVAAREASRQGCKDTVRYLYSVTHENILNPENGKFGVQLLNQCIKVKLFDIASDLVKKFPEILHQRGNDRGIYPIHALAITLSASPTEIGRRQARAFLRLVCGMVGGYSGKKLKEAVHEAMIEAAKHGNVEFIAEMVRAQPDLIQATDKNKRSMFWHAVVNRQERVFNLIYDKSIHDKNLLLWCGNKQEDEDEDGNNILHVAAMLPNKSVLRRTACPALRMQRELQWFIEVQNVAKPEYSENPNRNNVTPRQLFTQQHNKLVKAGKKHINKTAQRATTIIGAQVISVLVAVLFTALRVEFLSILSILFSTISCILFQGVRASHMHEEAFLVVLPRKLILAFLALFLSITTMVTALTLLLERRLWLVLPIILVACVTILALMLLLFPIISTLYNSTFRSSIFNKNTKLPRMDRRKKCEVMHYSSSVDNIV